MRFLRIFMLCLLVLAVLIAACFGCFKDIYKIYTYDDIEMYGTEYPVSKHIEYTVREYAESVFPEKIEPFFTVQAFSYKMCHEPAMHELYLEVTIKSENEYHAYVEELVGEKSTAVFSYDASFTECVTSYTVTTQHEGTTLGYSEIQKFLFSDETNTVIFVSIYIPYSDMPFPVTDFAFFNRFGITVVQGTVKLIYIN